VRERAPIRGGPGQGLDGDPPASIFTLRAEREGRSFEAVVPAGAAGPARGRVVPLDPDLALAAAKPGVDGNLPMADDMILATARDCGATLWTQDADFEGIWGRPVRAGPPPVTPPPADLGPPPPLP